jgi:hypothetical protein
MMTSVAKTESSRKIEDFKAVPIFAIGDFLNLRFFVTGALSQLKMVQRGTST